MFLKWFGFVTALSCVVLQAKCEQTIATHNNYIAFKQPTITNRQDESINDDAVNLLTTANEVDDDLDVPLSFEEILEQNNTMSTIENVVTSENGSDVTKPAEEENISDAGTQNSLETTHSTVPPAEELTEPNVSSENTQIESSETEITAETIIPTELIVEETTTAGLPSETDVLFETDAPLTSESPNNETEITSETSTVSSYTELTPDTEATTIDPKYRNETFEKHMKDFMSENPLAIEVTSPGFPVPYGEFLNVNWSVSLTNCTGIDIVIHYLDLDPFVPDALNIRGGDEYARDEKGEMLTGQMFNYSFKIIHTTSFFMWFNTGRHGFTEYQGFVLTYAPFGDTAPPTTPTEAPISIPPSDLQTIEILLVVPVDLRTNETWQIFKQFLAKVATDYVIDFNLPLRGAHPENITIFAIKECPDIWPNFETCIRFEFAIPLWNINYDPEIDFDFSAYDYELSSDSLTEMWELYGRGNFSELGYEEYTKTDGTSLLLLWTGISLAIIVIFVVVLYGIWRIDIFREYRRMYIKNDDQQDILKDKSELDISNISMYPIPHQPYPTLFETNEISSAGYYDSNDNSSSFYGSNFRSDIQPDKSNAASTYRPSTNPFSSNMSEMNDSQLFPDDEENFGKASSLSPRSKQRLLVAGGKIDESIT